MKTKLVLFSFQFLTALLICSSTLAQTPSELRRKRLESTPASDESAPGPKTAGDRRQEKLDKIKKDIVFGEEEDMFKVNEVNPKWKNESAVILSQKLKYSYISDGNNSKLVQLFRRRVKLQDKAAVDFFSEFYFSTSEDIGIRLIKKSGTVKDIDTKGAKSVDGDVKISSFYYTLSGSTGRKKLAIQDLEIGDIIDYYYKYENSVFTNNAQKAISFEAIILTLNWSYPVMAQKVDFEVERGFCINFNSYNGAPKIEEVTGGTNRRIKNFSMVDKDREKEKEEIWSYEYRSMPTIKFQVVYTSPRTKDDAPYFLGELWTPKSSVSTEELGVVAGRILMNDTDPNISFFSNAILDHLSKKYKTITDPKKFVEDAYYYFRAISLINPIDYSYSYSKKYRQEINDELFVKVMGVVLKRKQIKYEILAAIPRTIGTINELILTSEIEWLLKVEAGKSMYLYPFTRFSNPSDSKANLEGTEAYEITPNRNQKLIKVAKTTLPVTTHQQNNMSLLMEAGLSDNMELVTINRTFEVIGLAKNGYSSAVLIPTDCMESDAKKYNPDHGKEKGNKKRLEEAQKKAKEAKDEADKKKLEEMKKDAEKEFEVEKYESFAVTQDGRYNDSSELIFNEKFTAKNLTKKVGPNYIFEIGKLLGDQVQLKEEDMKRSFDVYMPYARSYTYDILLNIPKNYTVDGIAVLNMNVANATGGFVSEAKQEGTKLIVKIKKYYTHNYENKKDWPLMVAFLEKAFDFTQKKVLLKKG